MLFRQDSNVFPGAHGVGVEQIIRTSSFPEENMQALQDMKWSPPLPYVAVSTDHKHRLATSSSGAEPMQMVAAKLQQPGAPQAVSPRVQAHPGQCQPAVGGAAPRSPSLGAGSRASYDISVYTSGSAMHASAGQPPPAAIFTAVKNKLLEGAGPSGTWSPLSPANTGASAQLAQLLGLFDDPAKALGRSGAESSDSYMQELQLPTLGTTSFPDLRTGEQLCSLDRLQERSKEATLAGLAAATAHPQHPQQQPPPPPRAHGEAQQQAQAAAAGYQQQPGVPGVAGVMHPPHPFAQWAAHPLHRAYSRQQQDRALTAVRAGRASSLPPPAAAMIVDPTLAPAEPGFDQPLPGFEHQPLPSFDHQPLPAFEQQRPPPSGSPPAADAALDQAMPAASSDAPSPNPKRRPASSSRRLLESCGVFKRKTSSSDHLAVLGEAAVLSESAAGLLSTAAPRPKSAARKALGDKRERNPRRMRCQYCKTHQTPQWRSGPGGPRTLCNACGVRWNKGKLEVNGRAMSPALFGSECEVSP